jgi:hypothetical protein
LYIRREIGQTPASPPQQRLPQMGPEGTDEHVSPAAHARPEPHMQRGRFTVLSHHSPMAQQPLPQKTPLVQP